jgi:hypothetical protein
MSHTPGPWTIEYCDDDGNLHDDGVTIVAGEGPVAFRVIDCSAHLIAAAPDLLSALKYMVENAESEGWSGLMLSDAVAAIAKAEGRADV